MQGTIRFFTFWVASIAPLPLLGGDRIPALRPSEQPSWAALLAGLDSDEYSSRRSAAERLSILVRTEEHRSAIEDYLRQSPRAASQYSVRRQLETLGIAMGQPQAGAADSNGKPPANLDALVVALSSDAYLDRAAALDALQRAIHRQSTIDSLYPALKKAAAQARTPEARVALTRLLEDARYLWLTSGQHQPTIASDREISANIDALISKAGPSAQSEDLQSRQQIGARRDAAEWELLDALATLQSAEAARAAVVMALKREGHDDNARARLRRLNEWSQPGLAVEYWQRRQNLAIQYFIVGMSSQAPGASRPTRFDRVDNEVAVCASGNALRPGEYPLSVAFPHPREQAAFFQLVPFPTAKERLIYQYESQSLDDAARLRAITQRTLGPTIAAKRPFDEAQLWLLGQLDQPTVASLLRVYFAEVQDEPFDLSQLAPMLTDVSSVHRTACLMLALDGSPDVVPMLVEVAQNKRFLSLSTDEPQTMPWIAALAIAAREPWEGVDAWLAGLIDQSDRISFGPGPQADIGGAAAALLLSRHGHEPGDFGLVAREPLRRGLHDRFEAPINADYRRRMFEDRMFKQLGLTPHYFVAAEGRASVAAWWASQQHAPSLRQPTLTAPSPAYTARAARP